MAQHGEVSNGFKEYVKDDLERSLRVGAIVKDVHDKAERERIVREIVDELFAPSHEEIEATKAAAGALDDKLDRAFKVPRSPRTLDEKIDEAFSKPGTGATRALFTP